VLGSGVFLLNGTSLQQMNMNGFLISNLQVNNNAGIDLDGDVRIGSSLLLSAGKMSLNAANLYLGNGACVTGYDRDHFVITNGPGMLVREGLSADGDIFPVGSSDGMYRPVRLVRSGTRHEVGVRAMPGAFSNGDNGLPLTSAALNVSWEVKGSGTDGLGMKVGWEPGDELPGFDRSRAGIVWFEKGKGWAVPAGGGTNGGRFDLAVANTGRMGIFSIASGGIGEDESRVYPNPATTGFYVEVKGKCLLQLFDREGKLVQGRNAAGGTFYFGLDRGLAEGLYMLRIVREGGIVESRKIVVVR
jgi:hypothetical protein